MRILGISAFYHYSAAALVSDDRITAAAQEERFSRRKHDSRFPANAIRYCVAEAGISVDHVDFIAFYDKPFIKFERLIETYLAFAPRGYRSFTMALPLHIAPCCAVMVDLHWGALELAYSLHSHISLYGHR